MVTVDDRAQKLLDMCQQQTLDLIYLMLEIKAQREQCSTNGLKMLFSLRMLGGEHGEKYSIEEVDKRLKASIETLEGLKEQVVCLN